MGCQVKAYDDDIEGIHVEWRYTHETKWHMKDALSMHKQLQEMSKRERECE